MTSLQLNNITKTFGSARAVERFDLEVAEGEFISLLGGSGCGKTTTLRMIAGFESPSSGTIHIHGQEVENLPPRKRNIGFVFQNYALFPNLNVAANIAFGLKVARQSKVEWSARVKEMLELIHMAELADRYPHQISGGQQQRVALARALAPRPKLLLLDEPLSALDAKNRQRLRQEIRDIQQKLGITTIYVTHDQEEALAISDRIVVMDKGRIEQVGTPREIYLRPATTFTAGFIGVLNQLRGTWSGSGSETGLVSWEGNLLKTTSAGSPGDVDEVTLAIRPECLIWNGPGQNKLTGAVETVTFLGAVTRLSVRVGSSLVTVDHHNLADGTLPVVGQTLTLACSPADLFVLS